MERMAALRRTYVPAGRFGALTVAVVAAFVIGIGGGYLIRGLASAGLSTDANGGYGHRPFVVETAPYSTSPPSPIPEPTRDPSGFAVPI
jgi:hypothetical protein